MVNVPPGRPTKRMGATLPSAVCTLGTGFGVSGALAVSLGSGMSSASGFSIGIGAGLYTSSSASSSVVLPRRIVISRFHDASPLRTSKR